MLFGLENEFRVLWEGRRLRPNTAAAICCSGPLQLQRNASRQQVTLLLFGLQIVLPKTSLILTW